MIATRYRPEQSGAVLDTVTGLRTWYNDHAEAIRAALRMNIWIAQRHFDVVGDPVKENV